MSALPSPSFSFESVSSGTDAVKTADLISFESDNESNDSDYVKRRFTVVEFDPLFSFDGIVSSTNSAQPQTSACSVHTIPYQQNSATYSGSLQHFNNIVIPCSSSCEMTEIQDPFDAENLQLLSINNAIDRGRSVTNNTTTPPRARSTSPRPLSHRKSGSMSSSTGNLYPPLQSANNYETKHYALHTIEKSKDTEVDEFCSAVEALRSRYTVNDLRSNPGVVFCELLSGLPCSTTISNGLKVCIDAQCVGAKDPVLFTCSMQNDANALVCHVLFGALELTTFMASNYLLRVFGRSEYLNPEWPLKDHRYVQEAARQDRDLHLVLEEAVVARCKSGLQRTIEDMKHTFTSNSAPFNTIGDDFSCLNAADVDVLLNTFHNQRLVLSKMPLGVINLYELQFLRQTVQLIVAKLDFSSPQLHVAWEKLYDFSAKNPVEVDGVAEAQRRQEFDELLAGLNIAVIDLLNLYVNLINGKFHIKSSPPPLSDIELSIRDCSKPLQVEVLSVQRLPTELLRRIESGQVYLRVSCVVLYGGKPLGSEKASRLCTDAGVLHRSTAFRNFVVWGKSKLTFDGLLVRSLPRESIFRFTLYTSEKMTDGNESEKTIGWVNLRLLDANDVLLNGSKLLAMWSTTQVCCTTEQNITEKSALLLHINIADHGDGCKVVFPSANSIAETTLSNIEQEAGLHEACVIKSTRDKLLQIISKVSFEDMTAEERTLLWSHRQYICSQKHGSTPTDSSPVDMEDINCIIAALENQSVVQNVATDRSPLRTQLSGSAEESDPEGGFSEALVPLLLCLRDWSSNLTSCGLTRAYQLLRTWGNLRKPVRALRLVTEEFPDREVRRFAIRQLERMSDDQLSLYLPQLVQAFKNDHYITTSGLPVLLIRCCLSSAQFANSLFWLLKEAAESRFYRQRLLLLFSALMTCAGAGLRAMWKKQEVLVEKLSITALAVQQKRGAVERDTVLRENLVVLQENILNNGSVRLPHNIGLEVIGLQVKSCSYFSSFTVPLKLSFDSVDRTAPSIDVMFKIGDDLRVDNLALQLIRIMDIIWLMEGIDLRVVHFRVLSTSGQRGLVELVSECETLRRIQEVKGITGSFNHKVIDDWLRRQNQAELDYLAAVNNFRRSTAACVVATYLLGVCDRHNDNIMICRSGHQFHIDFAKLLGDAQRFVGISRDRQPFVFTSDMAYVVCGGSDRVTQAYHDFVELCCEALLALRRNRDLLLTAMKLLLSADINRLDYKGLQFMASALLPECGDDLEVTQQMTVMIEQSLNSTSVKMNFLVHNLAQAQNRSNKEGSLLSFVPRNYTKQQDGAIKEVVMEKFWYPTESRNNWLSQMVISRNPPGPTGYLTRSRSEFLEFHRCLKEQFPIAPLPSVELLNSGSKRRSVSCAVRASNLQKYVNALLQLAGEISDGDLVYTFFHPLSNNERIFISKDEPPVASSISSSLASNLGEIEMSLRYKDGHLTIFLAGARNLRSVTDDSSRGIPYPYVKCFLLPDSNKSSKRETRKLKERTSSPLFNELISYTRSWDELVNYTLQIKVCNKTSAWSSTILGAVSIPLNQLNSEIHSLKQWYPLQAL